MGYFKVRYKSRVVIYERKMFIRLATVVFIICKLIETITIFLTMGQYELKGPVLLASPFFHTEVVHRFHIALSSLLKTLSILNPSNFLFIGASLLTSNQLSTYRILPLGLLYLSHSVSFGN